MEILLCT